MSLCICHKADSLKTGVFQNKCPLCWSHCVAKWLVKINGAFKIIFTLIFGCFLTSFRQKAFLVDAQAKLFQHALHGTGWVWCSCFLVLPLDL